MTVICVYVYKYIYIYIYRYIYYIYRYIYIYIYLYMDHGHYIPFFFSKFRERNLKIGHPKRKGVFQPSIFRGYVNFRECNQKLEN